MVAQKKEKLQWEIRERMKEWFKKRMTKKKGMNMQHRNLKLAQNCHCPIMNIFQDLYDFFFPKTITFMSYTLCI